MLIGIAASQGIAIGRAVVIKETKFEIKKTSVLNTASEKERFQSAVYKAQHELSKIRDLAKKKLGEDEAQIFDSHIMMLQDPELIGAVELKIETESQNAESAFKEIVDMFASIFDSMDDEYMRARGADIRDVGKRVLNILLGIGNTSLSGIEEECILVSRDLTPSDTAQMDKDYVLGFITEIGGRTSHSAIMARTLEIPAVVGLGAVMDKIQTGDLLIIDGEEGKVFVNPEEDTLNIYREKQCKLAQEKTDLSKLLEAETVTVDLKRVSLVGNIGSPKDVDRVIKNGGEGIGLFRTEFLYMDSDFLPTEDEQYISYRKVLEAMGERPVVIRTLDIGGDKKLPYLQIEEEMNPFLGYRAIRLSLDRKDIFKTQLRALYRASMYGNLKIMFPMISGVQEFREAKKVVEEVKSELTVANIDFKDNVELGIMIEIPSAAIVSDVLAKEVDFFSIGTNDLIQYSIAVDRMNEKVSYLYDMFNPAVLRLIKFVIENAHKEGKSVGMCGEMAGDLNAIPILLGMGLDEFSMSPSSILKARKLIRSLNFEEAKKLTAKAMELETSSEIREYMGKFI